MIARSTMFQPGEPQDPFVPCADRSPSLRAGEEDGHKAFELKFVVDESTAVRLAAWADEALAPDPHGDPELDGAYRVTTVYLDTPALDVLHRSKGYRRSKYRVRRYGSEALLHLERKTKRQDLVRKERVAVPAGEQALLSLPSAPLGWAGAEFHERVQRLGLVPSAHVTYVRRAWFGGAVEESLRLTLDRSLGGGPSPHWFPPLVDEAPPILADRAVLEMKFAGTLPPAFQRLLAAFRLQPVALSKYRLCRALADVSTMTGAALRA